MKRLREVFKSEAGFTLIELLVVIAILGILAGIAVPRLTGVQEKAQKSALESTASSVRNAMEMFYASNGSYPDISGISDDTSLSAFATTIFTDEDITANFSDSNHQIQSTVDNSVDTSAYSLNLEDTDSTYQVTISSASGVGTVSAQ